jgi:hypothetical protein
MKTETSHNTGPQASSGAAPGKGDSLSMHADVPVWCDCCTCEAEPYWVEAFSDEEADSDSGNA